MRRLTGVAALAMVALVACGGEDTGPMTGAELAADLGCVSCHTAVDTALAPSWTGLANSTVTLDDGSQVVADADYIRKAITDPNAQVVEGYRPAMPVFQLGEDELDRLVEYIMGLSE